MKAVSVQITNNKMNDIKIFENEQFGKIRTAGTSDKPLFCLVDICKILGLRVDGVLPRLKKDGYNQIVVTDSLGRKQNAYFVNEQNLYKVIMRSDKPIAEPFQDWVCGEVLPTIRKTGQYGAFSVPQTFAEALRLAAKQQEQIEEQQRLIEVNKPKVEFFDAVAESKTAIEMKAVATTLNFINIGRNKLFEILRDNKVLQSNNMPYQRYVDNGYFRTIEQKFMTPDGEQRINIKTLVYQKGVDYIRTLLIKLGYKAKEQL